MARRALREQRRVRRLALRAARDLVDYDDITTLQALRDPDEVRAFGLHDLAATYVFDNRDEAQAMLDRLQQRVSPSASTARSGSRTRFASGSSRTRKRKRHERDSLSRRVLQRRRPLRWGIWCDWPNEHPTKYDWAEDGFGMTEAEAHAQLRNARTPNSPRASTPRRFGRGHERFAPSQKTQGEMSNGRKRPTGRPVVRD